MKRESSVTEELVIDYVEMARKHRKQIKIVYLDKKGKSEIRVVEPFDIRDRTFGGYCHLREEYRSFSYDRITRVTLTDFNHMQTPEEFKKSV